MCALYLYFVDDDRNTNNLIDNLIVFYLVFVYRSHAKAAVTIIATFLLTSWIVSAMVSLKFNYSLKVSEPLESFGFLYEKAWTRLGPYVMGMYYGACYVLFLFVPNHT